MITTTTPTPEHREGEGSVLTAPGLVLATDLDGTFLGGGDEGKRVLYDEIGRDPGVEIIFVTGRGMESVLPVLDDPRVPDPNHIIADVGATVLDGRTLEPVQPLQAEIDKRWPGTHRVLEALEAFGDRLERQEVPQERRCSFVVEPDAVDEELRGAVEALGCDLLLSAGRYLDVLPRGVTKGSTLRVLLEQAGLDTGRVVVAGDTLNDLALFETGFEGIVVGEAEPALQEAVERAGRGESAYIAEAPGAGGIVEGLRHFGYVSDASDTAEAGAVQGDGDAQLVIVYHRLPFEEVRVEGEIRRRRPTSPNGIIPTLLGFFAEGREGSWVAWSKQPTRAPEGFEPHVPVDPDAYPHLTAARIPLTEDDVGLFYETFSKQALWPIVFSFPGKVAFNEAHWEHYVEINRRFAEQAAAEAEQNALVWVHDYNLWLVPGFLRQLRPDLRIAFFHHTAFPPSDIFNVVPWRREIVSSLLQCDYVGFHIPRYVENFLDVARTHAPVEVRERVSCAPRYLTYGCTLGVDEMTTEVAVGDRTVRLGAHPVGIDVDAIERILAEERTRQKMEAVREELGARRCILSVERLDYVKGPLEKLHAFEKLLEDHPELHGEIVLVTVCTPPAPGMTAYDEIREQVDQAVGRINGRFSKLDWTPIHYFFRTLPFEEVVAYCAVSDVAWITPLRDGLNMVAKEYVAANGHERGDGVLLLSEFAGASAELHGALLTNPYHVDSMAEDLHGALTIGEEDRRVRMQRMRDIVRAYDIRHWGRAFLHAASGGRE